MMRNTECYFRCDEEGVFEYKLNVIFPFFWHLIILHGNGSVWFGAVAVSVRIENVNITNIMECCAWKYDYDDDDGDDDGYYYYYHDITMRYMQDDSAI